MDSGGVVTIMHVDVEGSTRLTTTVGDEVAQRVLSETKAIVRERAAASGGKEIDAVGDAMMLTFTSPRAAIASATSIQERIDARERQHQEDTLRVRIGLNVGEVLEHDGHPFGAAINAGARVMSYADGGEILVSEMVRNLAGTVPGVTFKDRGRHQFKGWDDPWRLYQVVWPGAPAPRPTKPRRVSRWWLLAAAVGVVAVGAAVVAVVTSGGAGSATLRSLPRNSVGHIDPRSGKLDRAIAVPVSPVALASHGTQLWVASGGAKSVTRIDETTGTQTTIPVDGHPTAIAADASGAWVAELADRKLQRVDTGFGHVSVTLPVAAVAIALGRDGLFDTVDRSTVERRDPRTGALLARRSLDLGAVPLALSPATLWVGGYSGYVQALDPRRLISLGPPTTLGGSPLSLAVADGSLWAVENTGSVQELSTRTSGILGTHAVPNASSVAATADSAFVGVPSAGEVVRISPEANIAIGSTPRALVADRGGVWIAAS